MVSSPFAEACELRRDDYCSEMLRTRLSNPLGGDIKLCEPFQPQNVFFRRAPSPPQSLRWRWQATNSSHLPALLPPPCPGRDEEAL